MLPSERLSLMQNDDLERLYISEYYSQSENQFDQLEMEIAKSKSEYKRQNSNMSNEKLLGKLTMNSKIKAI